LVQVRTIVVCVVAVAACSGALGLVWSLVIPDSPCDLVDAIRHHDLDEIDRLIRARYACGPCVGDNGSVLEFPLHTAAEFEDSTTIEALLRDGADPDCRDTVGNAPLERIFSLPGTSSADQERRRCAELLLEHGANINARDKCGSTVLFVAAGKGDAADVRYLLERGADVGQILNNGSGLLHCAAERGDARDEAVARILLEFGADASLRDANRNRPIDIARAKGARGLEAILSAAEADQSETPAQGNGASEPASD
jgi:ankyrin repeat protein